MQPLLASISSCVKIGMIFLKKLPHWGYKDSKVLITITYGNNSILAIINK